MCHKDGEAKEFYDSELFSLLVLFGIEGDKGKIPADVIPLQKYADKLEHNNEYLEHAGGEIVPDNHEHGS